MDLVFLIIGILITIIGASQRDKSKNRTGGGISLLTIGITITVVGALWFLIGFINSFNNSYEQAISSDMEGKMTTPSETKRSERQFPISSPTPAIDYESAYKTNFMRNCSATSDGLTSLCECTYDYLSSNYSLAARTQMDKDYLQTNQAPPALQNAINFCINTP